MALATQEQCRLRASVQIAAQMVLAPKAAASSAGDSMCTPRPGSAYLNAGSNAVLDSETADRRGPERLYYDESNWPDAYKNHRAASVERIALSRLRVPRAESRCSSATRCSSAKTRCSSLTSSAETYTRPSSFESNESVATQPTQPKVFRLQPRVCVMCDHCWRAKIPESRFHLLKCPNCLSDQPGDEYLTAAELRAQAEKCNEVLSVRDAEAAKRRKAAMADRARLRRYDQPWTPQLATQHDFELARAHEREQANFHE